MHVLVDLLVGRLLRHLLSLARGALIIPEQRPPLRELFVDRRQILWAASKNKANIVSVRGIRMGRACAGLERHAPSQG